ncbi:MAG: methyltransferase domain-containing protein [Deltaproteobacteria bacterium]|nr:MAG: methyltransferase domain-containing protein [Deltaproteobacteria bacterium]TMQ27131.1 MAG: methyltransferase domain-containing protein [Deltaproteobacteria bacterium]
MTAFAHESRHLAEIYDRVSDFQFEGGKRLVERLGLEEGARVLDVGCGTGRLARWIAERLVPRGSVVGIDPLEHRISVARSHAGTVRFEVGQAPRVRSTLSDTRDNARANRVAGCIRSSPSGSRRSGKPSSSCATSEPTSFLASSQSYMPRRMKWCGTIAPAAWRRASHAASTALLPMPGPPVITTQRSASLSTRS